MSTVRFLDVLNVQESGKTRKSFVLNPSIRWQTVDLPSRMGEEAISGNGQWPSKMVEPFPSTHAPLWLTFKSSAKSARKY